MTGKGLSHDQEDLRPYESCHRSWKSKKKEKCWNSDLRLPVLFITGGLHWYWCRHGKDAAWVMYGTQIPNGLRQKLCATVLNISPAGPIS